jgi:hypothetical protein
MVYHVKDQELCSILQPVINIAHFSNSKHAACDKHRIDVSKRMPPLNCSIKGEGFYVPGSHLECIEEAPLGGASQENLARSSGRPARQCTGHPMSQESS